VGSWELGSERGRWPPGSDGVFWVLPGSCRRSCSDLLPGQRGLLRSGSRISLTTHTQEQGAVKILTHFPLAFPAPSMWSGSGEKSVVGTEKSSGGSRGRETLCRAAVTRQMLSSALPCLVLVSADLQLAGWVEESVLAWCFKTKAKQGLLSNLRAGCLYRPLMPTLSLDLSCLPDTIPDQEPHS